MPNPSEINIALIGNPNSGKSTLFNLLTGMSQQIGNFPGVTVDKKVGKLTLASGSQVNLTDFPGLYSLYPNSSDERLVVDILCDPKSADYPDLVVYVADSNQLEKHLLLATQLIDLGVPLILASNMSDVSAAKNRVIDIKALSKSLGVPVVSLSARNSDNIDQLIDLISDWVADKSTITQGRPVYQLSKSDLQASDVVRQFSPVESDYRAKVIAHHHQWLSSTLASDRKRLSSDLLLVRVADDIDRRFIRLSGRLVKVDFTSWLDCRSRCRWYLGRTRRCLSFYSTDIDSILLDRYS